MGTLKKMILTLGLVLAGFATPVRANDGGAVAAPTARPAKVNLWKAQSPVKDQGRRGTCIAHSSIAALEAAYLRAGYEDIDLSEEFAIYAIKMFWLDPNRPRQPFATENKPGFLSGGFGNGYIHFMANGFMVPAEDDMPYRSYYPEEPSRPDQLAANWFFQYEVGRFNLNPKRFNSVRLSKTTFYGVKSYRDLSGRDTDQIEAVLAEGREVVWDFDVPESAEGSTKWVIDPKKSKILGGHSVLIVGYDRTDPDNPVFLIKNSWKGRERIRASY
ncbi:MAG TPA: C1 family peptidase, partial [Gemmataceae bacterium]|nr:C1 family peptidase [Gemmataceae bacterium]